MKIPNDWNMAKFGELAKITCGVAATPEYVDAAIGVPFLSARNVQKERLDLSYFQHIPRELHEKLTKNTKPAKGDVLLTRVGAGIGEAAIVDIDFEFSVYVSLTLIKCGKNLDSEYVKSLLNTNYYRYLATRDQFAGGGVQNLNVQMVKEYPIPVPPLPEQKKIAQILSTWDKAITTTEQLLANSQQQKKALMQQLLTGKKRLLDNNGVRFSGEWSKIAIGKIIKEIKKEKEVNPNSIELLTVKLHYKGVTRSGKFPNATERGRPYFRRYKGELIIGRQNLHNGGIAVVSDECNGLIASNAISSFEARKGVDINFILSLMSTEHFRFTVDNFAGGTGQKEIGVKELLSLSLIIPDFEEQQKIAAVLSTADQEITALQQKLDALKQEKKALMQQLLTGKRRVTLN